MTSDAESIEVLERYYPEDSVKLADITMIQRDGTKQTFVRSQDSPNVFCLSG